MKKFLLFLKKELLEMIPPTVFFFIAFSVTFYMRRMAAEQYNIQLPETATALIGALVVGKAILIVDALPFAKRVGRNCLAGNVIWKIFLNAVVVTIFQVLEEFLPMISEFGGIAEARKEFFGNVVWTRFWNTHMVLVLFLIIYNSAVVVIGTIGRKRFRQFLFGPVKYYSAD